MVNGGIIAVHLHPFAESLVLTDRTTGQVVFASTAVNTPDRIGLERVDYFSSVDGLKLHKGHEYELTSRYNNTSDAPVDSMAVMYLFLRSWQATVVGVMGIPICTLAAFIGLLLAGRTINVISLAGIAFAIGMTVDNTIVVLENIEPARARCGLRCSPRR